MHGASAETFGSMGKPWRLKEHDEIRSRDPSPSSFQPAYRRVALGFATSHAAPLAGTERKRQPGEASRLRPNVLPMSGKSSRGWGDKSSLYGYIRLHE